MIEERQIFLIVLTRKAKSDLQGDIGCVEEKLRDASNIRLYKLHDKKSKERDWVIALLIPDGSGRILMLKKDDDENYFICITVKKFSHLPDRRAFYIERSDQVRIVERAYDYLQGAIGVVECSDIEQEIENKEVWNPQKGSDIDFKKFNAYIDLYRKKIEKQRFGLPVVKYERHGKKARVVVDFDEMLDNNEVVHKIKKARGESIHFALLPPNSNFEKYSLGRLVSFEEKEKRMVIELSDKFNDFKVPVKEGNFYAPLEKETPVEMKYEQTEFPTNTTFYYDQHRESPAFSCLAEYNDEQNRWLIEPDSVKSQDDDDFQESVEGSFYAPLEEPPTEIKFEQTKSLENIIFHFDKRREFPAFSCFAERISRGEWRIAPGSIKPHKMMLFADFFGDISQLNIMNRGLRNIIPEDIWEVLSEDRVSKLPILEDINWKDDCRLNDKQREAVKKAIGAQELCLIWGPPGTGKTEVIMEIARQGCIREHKTLIASQANLAVDNALARLHGSDDAWTFRVAKDGYELEHEDRKKVPIKDTAVYFFKERLCTLIEKRMLKSENDNENDNIVSDLRRELVKRLKNEKKSQKQSDREILQWAKLYRKRINVVGATLMGTGNNGIFLETGIDKFDTVIVDEVSKALPTELFLPILRAKRVVLVGDHKQLPPMWKLDSGDFQSLEEWAEEVELLKEDIDIETTIFEKLWEKHKGDASGVRQMLAKQYRMHEDIQRLIEPFYTDSEGTLECGEEIQKQPDSMLISRDGPFANAHTIWVDTNHDADEKQDGTSFFNLQEIEIVGDILERLPHDKNFSVGVITFYGAQLRRLRDKYEEKYSKKFPDGRLIFGTVDRFQGRENDVIICSLVRKNKDKKVGFATKPNRINVAFSRARQLLCIVGNSGMFCFETRNKKAGELYTGIYKKCHKLSKGKIQN